MSKNKRIVHKGIPNIWDDPRTRVAQYLAYKGWTLHAIAEASQLRYGQTTYRLKQLGISTTQWRRGESEEAKEFAAKLFDKYVK